MNTYPFDSITINGREIKLAEILENTASPKSGFEASTFLFIQEWFSATDTFAQKTSGSTGAPKNIMISRQQMIMSAKLTVDALGLERGDHALLCLDPEFIAGKMMLVRSFVTGMKIIAITPTANPFHGLARSVSVDLTAIVPMQLLEIIESDQAYRLNSTKNILVGGAAMDPGIKNKLSTFNGRVYATYGMTETVSHIALQPLNGPLASEYFTVLPGIKISVDDRGCLAINAPHLEETIVTNDLVEINNSSSFRWLGRIDNVINTGGKKVIPEKIENEINRLFEQQKVKNKFLISSMPDPLLGNKIILIIEGDLKNTTVEILKSHLRENLRNYEVPKKIYTKISFILTENGKVNRKKTTQQIGN
jgi:O-succinylbenzoic acid--CoA ligase